MLCNSEAEFNIIPAEFHLSGKLCLYFCLNIACAPFDSQDYADPDPHLDLIDAYMRTA